jgi:hypothetical protein
MSRRMRRLGHAWERGMQERIHGREQKFIQDFGRKP